MDLELSILPCPLDAREFPPHDMGPQGIARRYKWCSFMVLISRDPDKGRIRWHLSISHPTRYPKWDEIKEARYKFLPDEVTMAQILPPRGEYVNVHPNCFHLHEIDGA